ncbi:uncharacterized protein [Amphiura filiformis]|uniref:uncharacterized protein n=1 Tax=Amphiura filiformis TaxID=82378 RepID=UPI003B2287B2
MSQQASPLNKNIPGLKPSTHQLIATRSPTPAIIHPHQQTITQEAGKADTPVNVSKPRQPNMTIESKQRTTPRGPRTHQVTISVPPQAQMSQPVAHVLQQPSTSSSETAPVQIPLSQSEIEKAKKCKNFLMTVIKLASNAIHAPETVQNVKHLVQNLLDGRTEPEEFTQKLQKELHSSPQPYLVPFLKKSLPLLRQTLPYIEERIFLNQDALKERVNRSCQTHGLQNASTEVIDLISFAAQTELKSQFRGIRESFTLLQTQHFLLMLDKNIHRLSSVPNPNEEQKQQLQQYLQIKNKVVQGSRNLEMLHKNIHRLSSMPNPNEEQKQQLQQYLQIENKVVQGSRNLQMLHENIHRLSSMANCNEVQKNQLQQYMQDKNKVIHRLHALIMHSNTQLAAAQSVTSNASITPATQQSVAVSRPSGGMILQPTNKTSTLIKQTSGSNSNQLVTTHIQLSPTQPSISRMSQQASPLNKNIPGLKTYTQPVQSYTAPYPGQPDNYQYRHPGPRPRYPHPRGPRPPSPHRDIGPPPNSQMPYPPPPGMRGPAPPRPRGPHPASLRGAPLRGAPSGMRGPAPREPYPSGPFPPSQIVPPQGGLPPPGPYGPGPAARPSAPAPPLPTHLPTQPDGSPPTDQEFYRLYKDIQVPSVQALCVTPPPPAAATPAAATPAAAATPPAAAATPPAATPAAAAAAATPAATPPAAATAAATPAAATPAAAAPQGRRGSWSPPQSRRNRTRSRERSPFRPRPYMPRRERSRSPGYRYPSYGRSPPRFREPLPPHHHLPHYKPRYEQLLPPSPLPPPYDPHYDSGLPPPDLRYERPNYYNRNYPPAPTSPLEPPPTYDTYDRSPYDDRYDTPNDREPRYDYPQPPLTPPLPYTQQDWEGRSPPPHLPDDRNYGGSLLSISHGHRQSHSPSKRYGHRSSKNRHRNR